MFRGVFDLFNNVFVPCVSILTVRECRRSCYFWKVSTVKFLYRQNYRLNFFQQSRIRNVSILGNIDGKFINATAPLAKIFSFSVCYKIFIFNRVSKCVRLKIRFKLPNICKIKKENLYMTTSFCSFTEILFKNFSRVLSR